MSEQLQEKTIKDFGTQWQNFRDNEGFYGSLDLFRDVFHPILNPEEIKGYRVADIGSGTGRIVNMLLAAGASHVTAVEPSKAFEVLCENTQDHKDKVTLLNVTGDNLPPSGDLDYVFSYGVLHHIPEPGPTVKAAYNSLRPGGKIAIWLYGKEGNRLYLLIFGSLRLITKYLPHPLLLGLSWILDIPLVIYIKLCKKFKLPLHEYMTEILGRLSPEKRRWNIYDQLNPAYAKYYSRQEAIDLVKTAGFEDIKIHHRHGYSWSVVGTKPGNKKENSTE